MLKIALTQPKHTIASLSSIHQRFVALDYAMKCEKLISAVFERPIVWDKRNKLHANRIPIDKKWLQISQEMVCEETLLKKKRKYVRDQFAIERGKLPPTRSGDGAENSQLPKWRYFKSVLLLKDVVTPRTTKGPLKSLLSNDTAAAGSSQDMFDVESQISSLDAGDNTITPQEPEAELETQTEGDRQVTISDAGPIFQEQGRRKRKRDTIDDYRRSVLQIEERKLDYLLNKSNERKREEADETLLFVKSLLPHISRIPQQHILRIRRRFKSLDEEFAYPQSMSECESTMSTNYNYKAYSDVPQYRSLSYSSQSSLIDHPSHITFTEPNCC